MTIYYPDVASGQGAISFAGCAVACAKATEGTDYANPFFGDQKASALAHGTYLIAYHFLRQGAAAGQARFAHSVADGVPLMVDFEPEPALESFPRMADAEEFIDAYRTAGGITHLLYLPNWYWQQLGQPSLQPFTDRGMHLVSSQYVTYSDTGPGWQPYGGMTPVVWQYADDVTLNGVRPVDFNAYKGTIAQFRELVTGASPPPPPAIQAVLTEETMPQLLPQTTDPIPLALPNNAAGVRFFTNSATAVVFHVDTRAKDGNWVEVSISYDGAFQVDVPKGSNGFVVHRSEAALPISYAVSGKS